MIGTTTAVKLRVAAVAVLVLIPIAGFYALGAYYLWTLGGWWSFAAWAVSSLFFLAAYVLGWYWTRRGRSSLLPNPGYDDPLNYWTERDKVAWAAVEKHASELPELGPEDLQGPDSMKRMAGEAQALALIVTQIYRPGAKDPFGHLTMPEILACFELVSHDMAVLVDKYVPGSHALTINNFKQIQTAAKWYNRGQNVYWLISALMNPLKAAVQIVTTKAGIQSAFAQVQKNVMTWFYLTYVHQLGRYLIELNSGRLKVGAKRYQELMAQHKVPPVVANPEAATATSEGEVPSAPVAGAPAAAPPTSDPLRVTVAVVGPVKAGKSSLINAMFGERKAAVDTVPLTATSTRYDLNTPGLPPLTFIDTAGFGLSGAGEADVHAAVDAVSKADLMLLVVPARSAARSPEVDFVDRIYAEFAAKPHLKRPPAMAALTHVDALTPAMEWKPPYNFEAGTRPKEVSVREAVAAAKEAFADRMVEVIPVCTAAGRELGVKDPLLPTMAALLGEARGVSLLRALHLESAINHTKKIIGQLWNAGKQMFKVAVQSVDGK